MVAAAPQTGYAEVDGLHMYDETRRARQPLALLLHGDFGNHRGAWDGVGPGSAAPAAPARCGTSKQRTLSPVCLISSASRPTPGDQPSRVGA
jgi:hypothetical protein